MSRASLMMLPAGAGRVLLMASVLVWANVQTSASPEASPPAVTSAQQVVTDHFLVAGIPFGSPQQTAIAEMKRRGARAAMSLPRPEKSKWLHFFGGGFGGLPAEDWDLKYNSGRLYTCRIILETEGDYNKRLETFQKLRRELEATYGAPTTTRDLAIVDDLAKAHEGRSPPNEVRYRGFMSDIIQGEAKPAAIWQFFGSGRKGFPTSFEDLQAPQNTVALMWTKDQVAIQYTYGREFAKVKADSDSEKTRQKADL